MPPQTVTVKCPQCQQIYIDWYIPALNPSQAMATSCSKCGHRETLDKFTLKGEVLQIKTPIETQPPSEK